MAEPNISVLLSQALVAFIIECDNEAEYRIPHRTAADRSNTRAPWLTSIAMYSTCLQYMPVEGITVKKLEARVRTNTNLGGMRRWGYISLEPKPLNLGGKGVSPNSFIRLTEAGQRSKELWAPIPGEIEARWRQRFRAEEIDKLRQSLSMVVRFVSPKLPDCLPILGLGMFTMPHGWTGSPFVDDSSAALNEVPLPDLLARALIAFAIEFEADSRISLALCADLIRVVPAEGVPIKDLPKLSGVSKEAIAIGINCLEKAGCLIREPITGSGRGQQVRLTDKGLKVRVKYFRLIEEIEESWRKRFGAETIAELKGALLKIVGDGTADASPLFKGLEPYPDCWRAKIAQSQTLPHFPMVLHRGGYPDGS